MAPKKTTPKKTTDATASISAAAARTTASAFSSFDGTSLYDDPTTTCDWAVEHCCMVGEPPLKCQRLGCFTYLHHLCSIQWVMKNKLPEGGIANQTYQHST
jgi:hypothetical protein